MRLQYRFVTKSVLWLFLLLQATSAWSQITVTNTPPPQWEAWRVFYGSLVYYSQKSPANLSTMLTDKFGLNADQSAWLLTSGQKYISDTQQILLQTKAEVRKRYIPYFSAHPGAMPPSDNMTNLDRAKRDGLYAQMEGLHQNAVDAHLNVLKAKLTADQITQITTFVQTTVLSGIKTYTIGPNPPTKGTGLPPGLRPGAQFPPPLQ